MSSYSWTLRMCNSLINRFSITCYGVCYPLILFPCQLSGSFSAFSYYFCRFSCRLVVKVASARGRLLQHLLFCSFPTHWSTPSGHSTRQMLCSVSPVYCLTDFLSLCLSDSSLTVGSGPDASTAPQKLLILDARSYTAAVANRAKGGGCECEGKQQSLSPHTHSEFTQGTVLLGGDMLMHSCAVSQSNCHAVKTSKRSGFFSARLMFSTSRTGRSERVKGLETLQINLCSEHLFLHV